VPHLIDVAFVHGRVGITEVADIHNTRVLDVAAHIAGAAVGREKSGVTMLLHDGRTATATVKPPLARPRTG
jgi:hypothetical protein